MSLHTSVIYLKGGEIVQRMHLPCGYVEMYSDERIIANAVSQYEFDSAYAARVGKPFGAWDVAKVRLGPNRDFLITFQQMAQLLNWRQMLRDKTAASELLPQVENYLLALEGAINLHLNAQQLGLDVTEPSETELRDSVTITTYFRNALQEVIRANP